MCPGRGPQSSPGYNVFGGLFSLFLCTTVGEVDLEAVLRARFCEEMLGIDAVLGILVPDREKVVQQ